MIDLFSCATVKLNLFSLGNLIGTGTGFYYKLHGSMWLVSNWHVIAGRSVMTGQPRHSSSAVPDEVRTTFYTIQGNNIVSSQVKFPLVVDEENLWLQHSKGQNVDLAMLELSIENFDVNDVIHVNISEPVDAYVSCSDMDWGISSEAFILGFPDIRRNTQPFPIWKRGTIASEPSQEFDESNVFLLDTATSEGMSGSPVLLRSSGNYVNSAGTTKSIVTGYGATKITQKIGVYSGRYREDDDPLAPQLGKAWHIWHLEEIVKERVKGSFELKKEY